MEVKNVVKQTEIGLIPQDWLSISILGVCEDKSDSIKIGPFGSQLKKEYLVKRGYKVYGQENVYEQNMEIGNRYISKDRFQTLRTCELLSGDFIISMMGTIGQCMLVPSNFEPGIMDSHLIRIRLNTYKINPLYLLHFFSSELTYSQILKLSVGGIMAGLSSAIIKKIFITLPPLPEQDAIAEALSDMDALIAAQEALIAKKRAIKQGVMQELLKPKDDWVEKTIEEVADCLDGLRIPLNESQREKMRGNIPYCGANGVLDYINEYRINDSVILLAEDGGYFDEYRTRPIAYKMNGKIWVNNHAHVLKAKKDYDQNFLFYSLVNKNILNFITSGTRAKLNRSEMNKIPISLPKNKFDQHSISNILSNIDQELSFLIEKSEKIILIKQGMMQEILTGRIRLTGE